MHPFLVVTMAKNISVMKNVYFFERRSAKAAKAKADKARAKLGNKQLIPEDCWTGTEAEPIKRA